MDTVAAQCDGLATHGQRVTVAAFGVAVAQAQLKVSASLRVDQLDHDHRAGDGDKPDLAGRDGERGLHRHKRALVVVKLVIMAHRARQLVLALPPIPLDPEIHAKALYFINFINLIFLVEGGKIHFRKGTERRRAANQPKRQQPDPRLGLGFQMNYC